MGAVDHSIRTLLPGLLLLQIRKDTPPSGRNTVHLSMLHGRPSLSGDFHSLLAPFLCSGQPARLPRSSPAASGHRNGWVRIVSLSNTSGPPIFLSVRSHSYLIYTLHAQLSFLLSTVVWDPCQYSLIINGEDGGRDVIMGPLVTRWGKAGKRRQDARKELPRQPILTLQPADEHAKVTPQEACPSGS